MSKYLTINDAVRAHIDDSAVYYSDATQSLNQLADSMGNEEAHASTIADALDRVLSSSGSESGSDQSVVLANVDIPIPVKEEQETASIDEETYNALMDIPSDGTGSCIIKLTFYKESEEQSEGSIPFSYEFICRNITDDEYFDDLKHFTPTYDISIDVNSPSNGQYVMAISSMGYLNNMADDNGGGDSIVTVEFKSFND